MTLRNYSHLKFGIVLGTGALIAMVLCVQCVRTYLYTDAVLVPQQAGHDAARQVAALGTAARSAGITEPRLLGPVLQRALEAASDRIIWMRVFDINDRTVAQAGNPQGLPQLPAQWWIRFEGMQDHGTLVDTPQGRALVLMLPFRMPRPNGHGGPPDHRPAPSFIEVAISLKAVAGAFQGLQQNLIVGVIASFALLLSVAVIGLRAPRYLRGRYLESELKLAKQVQSDLQPKPHFTSRYVEFAASAVAADHVGGDFFDVFEAECGKVAIVLGDVSGKGVSAALLVSVLHGAIRSSTASQHELACERINRMLCERTACERFATLFWGVFDPSTNTLRYVNAGHAAPMLVRNGSQEIERLEEGGPVLGVLSDARYTAGSIRIDDADRLILYSDGINEATNQQEEEFGEDRMIQIVAESPDASPEVLCGRIVNQANTFASCKPPQDDRTLLVMKFRQSEADIRERKSRDMGIAAVA